MEEKKIVPIKGMHCRSCEIIIEEKLREIPGLIGVKVDYKKQQAEFFMNYPATQGQVHKAILEEGYKIGKEEKDWISKDPKDYKDLAVALAILIALYIVARKFGLINLSIGSSGNPSSLLVVLLVGLTAGVSTCMALVGGLILGISARYSEKHPETTSAQKFRPHLFFNLGRILSYAALGGIIGLIGKAFQLSNSVLGLLIIGVGFVMLVLGLQLTGLFPKISSGSLTLPTSLSKLFGLKKHHEKEYSHWNSIITGALTFFLPCGFTQAMQLYAMSTGNFFSGAAIMGVFALGTAPGLLGVGGITSVIRGGFAKKFFKFAGLLVISLSLFNISNGFNLTGWKGISIGGRGSSPVEAVRVENGFQIVNMTQNTFGYEPNKFIIRRGVPVKWIIDAKDTSSCSGSIVASKIDVQRFLKLGENVIEFTPTNLGDIKFSCSMGMYSGKFTVIENNGVEVKADQSKTIPSNNSVDDTATPAETPKDVQLIKATFIDTNANSTTDIAPNEFTVQSGKPVRFEIYAEVEGQGCMSTIEIPKLADTPQFLQRGKTIVFEFTPKEKGDYLITCAMGAIRGKITVN